MASSQSVKDGQARWRGMGCREMRWPIVKSDVKVGAGQR